MSVKSEKKIKRALSCCSLRVGGSRTILLGGVLVVLVYLGIAWFVLPPQAIWSPDTGAKFLQLQNLRIEDGRLAYDILYPGKTLDPHLKFAHAGLINGLITIREGKQYFQRLPIFPLVSLFMHRCLGVYGLYVLPAVGGGVSGLLAMHLLKKKDRRTAMWVLIAFGSPILIYSTIFWEHTLATTLGLCGAWLALRMGSANTRTFLQNVLGWSVVGIIMGLGVLIRLEIAIFAIAWLFAQGLIIRQDRWSVMWAGAWLGLFLFLYRPLHAAMFGGQDMPTNATYLFYPFFYLSRAQWQAVPDLLIGPSLEGGVDTGWLGGLWAMAALVSIVHSFASSKAAYRVSLLAMATTVVVGAIFLFDDTFHHSAHGLLFTTPWALLGLVRAFDLGRRGNQRIKIIALSTVLGLIGYVVGMVGLRAGSPHGGLEWGARFALTFYPLLALMAGWNLGEKRDDIKTLLVVGGLLFLGIGFQLRGIWTIRHDKRINVALEQAVLEVPEQHVVSDLWWLPFNTSFIYPQKQIFVIDTPEELKEWVDLAANHQVRRFAFLTQDNSLLDNTDWLAEAYRLDIIERFQLRNLWLSRVDVYPE